MLTIISGNSVLTVTTFIDITMEGSSTEFTVDLSKTSSSVNINKLSVSVIDPFGTILPNKLVSCPEFGVYRVVYSPVHVGRHNIELFYDKKSIPGSPFFVNIRNPCNPNLVKVSGDGLHIGMTGELCRFSIETREAGVGGVTLAIEGPSETKLKCKDNRNGSCNVEYQPTEPGEYEITILFADKHVPGSPFKVNIKESIDPAKVKVYGPGIDDDSLIVGVPTYFNIDVAEAGPGLVGVTLNNLQGIPVDNVHVENKGNALYCVHFVPPAGGSLVANVKFAHKDVPLR